MTNIWTNGCFDILHIGHIKLFEYAKSLGCKLHVGIDSDQRIKHNKGPTRPINTQEDRLSVLSAIKFIDTIDIFESDEQLESLIQRYDIDTIVVGDDYKSKRVVGSTLVQNVVFFAKIPKISSSYIYESIIRTS